VNATVHPENRWNKKEEEEEEEETVGKQKVLRL
jgi:hypothetical protein